MGLRMDTPTDQASELDGMPDAEGGGKKYPLSALRRISQIQFVKLWNEADGAASPATLSGRIDLAVFPEDLAFLNSDAFDPKKHDVQAIISVIPSKENPKRGWIKASGLKLCLKDPEPGKYKISAVDLAGLWDPTDPESPATITGRMEFAVFQQDLAFLKSDAFNQDKDAISAFVQVAPAKDDPQKHYLKASAFRVYVPKTQPGNCTPA